ncbi:mitochondrial splicing system protein, partial [Ascosphaera pollenicola]
LVIHIDPEGSEESLTSPIKISGCHDGVVDVELPLPGFVSFSSSTDSRMISSTQNIRQSAASTDNCGSFQSTISGLCPSSWKEYDGLNINVAGWLKRFHEDFLLQAVRPYDELEADIRRAMSAEPTPSNVLAMMSDEDYVSGDQWYDVCTTLIADVKARSVKQLRLQRRSKSKKPARNNSCYSSVSTQSQMKPSTIDMEEQFIEEAVVEVDAVFIEAVDRVLARNNNLSKARSSAVSRGRNGRSASVQTNTPLRGCHRQSDLKQDHVERADETSLSEVPRAECSRLVLGALEEVVRSVTAERYSEDEHGDDVSITPNRHYRRSTNSENTLREGIRKWLSEVEESG